jgi:hypothetical protein
LVSRLSTGNKEAILIVSWVAGESGFLRPVAAGLVLEVLQGHDARNHFPLGRAMLSLQRVRKYRRRKAVD